MKHLLSVLFLISCSVSHSQESSISSSASSVEGLPTATAADVISTTTTGAARPSPWKLTLASENFTYESDQRNFGSKAPIISYNWIGVRYIVSPLWELDLRQQFQYSSNLDNLGARDSKLHSGSSTELAELVLRVAAKPKNLLGSSVSVFEVRYFAPTDRVARELNELGRIRADAWMEWAMTSKFTLAGWVSPRVQLNSSNNPNKAVGADAEYYQVKAAPYFIYNMNDHIAPYYAYNLVGKFSQAQRGNWEPDMANIGAHETGLFVNYGAFMINPSLISETNLENGGGSFLTEDSRAYSYENLSYNLNLYATF